MITGFLQVKYDLIYDVNLSPIQLRVLMVLIQKQEYTISIGEEYFYCYESWIGSNLHISIRSVKMAIKYLKDNGYIKVQQKKGTDGRVNYYRVNPKYFVNSNPKVKTDVG